MINEYRYQDLAVGWEESFQATVTQEMVERFRDMTGDINPLHCDRDFARAKGFKACVVYGMLTAAFYSTLGGVYLPGKYCLIHSIETKFLKPVYAGDSLTIKGVILEKNDTVCLLTIKAQIKNQNDEKVSKAIMKVGMLDG